MWMSCHHLQQPPQAHSLSAISLSMKSSLTNQSTILPFHVSIFSLVIDVIFPFAAPTGRIEPSVLVVKASPSYIHLISPFRHRHFFPRRRTVIVKRPAGNSSSSYRRKLEIVWQFLHLSRRLGVRYPMAIRFLLALTSRQIFVFASCIIRVIPEPPF